MEDRLIHLHVHSEYSLLDGCGSQLKFAQRAKELGQDAIGFTEHGSMRGAHGHHTACEEVGIKPIFGFEAYVVKDHTVKALSEDVLTGLKEFKADEQREAKYQAEVEHGIRPKHHLTLIAQTTAGLVNLFRLSSLGWTAGYASWGRGNLGRPRVDLDLIEEHSEGLICLTGCPGGLVARELADAKPRQALKNFDRLLSIFGKERVFAEIMPHGSVDGLAKTNRQIAKIARNRGVNLVATQDAHYVHPQDWEAHEALLSIMTHGNLISPIRFRFTGHEYWFKTDDEMRKGFEEQGLEDDQIDEALETTQEIADSCTAEFEVDKFAALLPAIEIDSELRDDFGAWREKKYGKGLVDA